MVFFNFLNFFAIFLEFSITLWVGTKRNDNFYFLSLSLFQPILARNDARMDFYHFFNFFASFFGIFCYASSGNEMEQRFLFSQFLGLFKPILAWNEATMVFFYFFSLFLEFSITCRVITELKDNFYFFSFSAFSNLFWLEMKP